MVKAGEDVSDYDRDALMNVKYDNSALSALADKMILNF